MVDVGFSLGSWFTVCFMGHGVVDFIFLFVNSMLFMGASCGGCLLFGGFFVFLGYRTPRGGNVLWEGLAW